ncbi:hypothetical protein [Qipengyuania sp.]|uniref:hypothetical protein n=1 Tax=Qipengyuania sp. TaxID=2004515 RepID=UPI003BA846AD
MNLLFGVAGAPRDAQSRLDRSIRQIAGENGDLFVHPMDSGGYDEKYCTSFLNRFEKPLANDHHNRLKRTAFVALIIERPNIDIVCKFVSPALFARRVEWNFTHGSATISGKSVNELVKRLRAAANEARTWVTQLGRNLAQNDNRTPLLLPYRNFRSSILQPSLDRFQKMSCGDEDDAQLQIDSACGMIESSHPRKSERGKRSYFVDDTGLQFHPPGSARHGFSRPNFKNHEVGCLLNGRRRLGFPYDPAFHYDCTFGRNQVRANLCTCHEDFAGRKGNPHLNVAPNDFLRGLKK